MIDFLTYDLKVAVLIIVFYMFYRLLLSHETFHRVNRVVLVLTAVASFVLPLCVITIHKTVQIVSTPEVAIGDVQIALEDAPATPRWQVILPILYIIGLTATLGHTLLSVLKVMLLIRRSERHPQPDGITICVIDNAQVAPFSWMRYIVMNRGDYEAQDTAILAHERGHIRLRHSWDILLVDLLTAFQWFNPAIWMVRQDLRTIHEYEADGEVLSQGINARQYQYLLISKATGIGGYSIANGINHSTLKKRIYMMTNMKSKSNHLLKLLALVPIVGVTLALNARTVTDYVYDEPQKQQPVKKGQKAGTINMGGKNIEVVESNEAVLSTSADDKRTPAKFEGVVYDKATGEAIVGAIVKVSGSTLGTVTGSDGKFSLDVKIGDKIEVMYVGMETFTTIVRKESTYFNIDLSKENAEANGEKVYDVVEQMPQFPGGTGAMMEFLGRSIRYPKEAMEANIQGRVVVNFNVGKDGAISGARIVRSVDPSLDAEALRVINSMPNWMPGKQQGEPVSVRYTCPVTFRLSGENNFPASLLNDTKNTDNVQIEIDGVKTDKTMEQIVKELNPNDIESIKIDKSNPDVNLVKIITKKKQ